jgi:hypothetical protein
MSNHSKNEIRVSPLALRYLEPVVKTFLYLLAIAVLTVSRPIRTLFLDLPRAHQFFLLLLVGGLLVGQINRDSSDTYPFAAWTMYAKKFRAREVVVTFDYRGVLSDGSESEFPVRFLVRTFGSRFRARMDEVMFDMDDADTEAERRENHALAERSLRSAWSSYRVRHPEPRFQRVRIFKRVTPMSRLGEASAVQRSLVMQLELP